MALEKLAAFTFNHAQQVDNLGQSLNNSTLVKQKFDSRAEELRLKFNALIDALIATTDSASGADQIGATAIAGLTGANVQALLEALNTAKLNLSGGTLTGAVVAHPDTDYTTRRVRNIILSTADADVNAMQNGDIWIKYQ